MNRNPRQIGIAQVMLSGVFFGVLGVSGKSVFENGVKAGELLSLRFLIAAILLWPVVLILFPRHWRLRPREIALCAGLGTGGYALFSSCFFLALQGMSASLTVLLLYLYPIFVSLLAWMFLGEKIPRQKWPALPLAMIGLVLLVWDEFSVERVSSLLLGVGSAVFYSAYILVSSRFLKGIPPLVSITYILSFAGIALSALHQRDLEHVTVQLTENWRAMLAIVFLGTVGAMTLFLAGLQKLKAWEVSILSMLEPITGIALAVLILGERLNSWQGIGAAGIMGALVFVSLPSKRSESG
ncbi:MAG: hypothetical protein A2X94_06675 [Bdellovibrionales bacterium GWB1_55_8]|nr:MAG: hypothetical protein A2X94_06675 [Bdellovibrionales bacterium GWB1_55_8]